MIFFFMVLIFSYINFWWIYQPKNIGRPIISLPLPIISTVGLQVSLCLQCFCLSLSGFLPQSKHVSTRLTGNSNWSGGVSENGCLCLCSDLQWTGDQSRVWPPPSCKTEPNSLLVGGVAINHGMDGDKVANLPDLTFTWQNYHHTNC